MKIDLNPIILLSAGRLKKLPGLVATHNQVHIHMYYIYKYSV
jgi:hypothetical protein